jgi:hypothetical protein
MRSAIAARLADRWVCALNSRPHETRLRRAGGSHEVKCLTVGHRRVTTDVAEHFPGLGSASVPDAAPILERWRSGSCF